MTLLLCLAMAAVGAYALFSESVTLKNHLEAGTMDITLTRIKLVTTHLDATTGMFERNENTDRVDFSEPTEKNVFGFKNAMLIAPGSFYSADMEIANRCDVTFGYWLEILFDEDAAGSELAKQIKITVVTSDGTVCDTLDKSAGLIGKADETLGVLAEGDTAFFTVGIEFLDLEENNSAKAQNLEFDVVVHAVQFTADASD
jgi:hypothetical protein